MKIKSFQNTYVPRLLAILSGLFLLVRSFQYANILPARLDESLFLYKEASEAAVVTIAFLRL